MSAFVLPIAMRAEEPKDEEHQEGDNVKKTDYDELIVRILDSLHNKVCQILLYGSDSGEAEQNVAVLTPYKISFDEEARLSDTVFEWNQKHREKISVIDIDQALFAEKSGEIPFYQMIDRTGIVLWPQPEFLEP